MDTQDQTNRLVLRLSSTVVLLGAIEAYDIFQHPAAHGLKQFHRADRSSPRTTNFPLGVD